MQLKTKNRIVFWIRMVGWIATGCVAPISVFATKFGLFKQSGYEVTTDELGNTVSTAPIAPNGWGIISCLIILWTLLQIIKEVKDAYSGYSFKKQCLDGFIKLIPLITMLVVCFFLRGAIDEIIYCLIVVIISRICSVPINPLPKWNYEVKGVENYEDALTTIIKHVRNKMKGGE